jgi:hypothetical protein
MYVLVEGLSELERGLVKGRVNAFVRNGDVF